jgi:hypothetical protein
MIDGRGCFVGREKFFAVGGGLTRAGLFTGWTAPVSAGAFRPRPPKNGFSPTAQRNRRADWGKDSRLLIVQCLANFRLLGLPILADNNGIPAAVGVFSAFHEETGLMFAASATNLKRPSGT